MKSHRLFCHTGRNGKNRMVPAIGFAMVRFESVDLRYAQGGLAGPEDSVAEKLG